MKTILKTSVKGNESVTVKESVREVHTSLEEKGNYILVTRITSTSIGLVSIRKSTIKMVTKRKL